VNKGDIFVVMGGNGCGKTTLMRALVGLQRPAAGSVLYSGEDFWNADGGGQQRRLKRRLGILFQGGALWSSLTLAENVALPIAEYTGLPPAGSMRSSPSSWRWSGWPVSRTSIPRN
jgi:phospholipid/cholesterol/gamma-HCH transport system ATP-binding protein